MLPARVSSDNVDLPASPASTVSIDIDEDDDDQNDDGKTLPVGMNYPKDNKGEKIANDHEEWKTVHRKRGANSPLEAKNGKSKKKKSKVAEAVKSIEDKSPQSLVSNNVSQQ